jgi:hypothetical protein
VGEKENPPDPALGDLGSGQLPKPGLPKDTPPPAFELPQVLQLKDPREIMRRLLDEDPFELRSRCIRCAREHAVILNPKRLVVEAASRISVKASGYAGEEPIGQWVERIVEQCVSELISDQSEEERRGLPVPDSPDAEFYEALAEVLQVPIYDVRMACVTLNGMSDAHRETFHAVIVQGRSLVEYSRETGQPLKYLWDLLREIGLEVSSRLEKRRRARRRRRE